MYCHGHLRAERFTHINYNYNAQLIEVTKYYKQNPKEFLFQDFSYINFLRIKHSFTFIHNGSQMAITVSMHKRR